MTFTLTGECVFCHKKRVEWRAGDVSKGEHSRIPKELWETLLMVFFTRKDHHPDDKVFSEVPPIEHRFGWVVTICRECRKTHSVEELILAAKEVY